MLSWKEIVQDYIIKHSNRIKKVSQPVHDHFGVGYFTYHRIDNAGNYTVLVDRPDWAEHYVSEQFYLQDPYLRHPDVYQSGFTLIEAHGSKDYLKTVLKAGKEIFNLDMGLMMIEKSPDGVEFFGFAANKATSNLDRIYLNQPHLLKSFARHFKEELQPILFEMQQETIPLSIIKGKDFHCQQAIHPALDLDACHAFLADVGVRNELVMVAKLSLREKQCLKLLLDGKSAKETAQRLGLSSRTVEFYFENIKNKLLCTYKQDVLIIAKRLKALGLIP